VCCSLNRIFGDGIYFVASASAIFYRRVVLPHDLWRGGVLSIRLQALLASIRKNLAALSNRSGMAASYKLPHGSLINPQFDLDQKASLEIVPSRHPGLHPVRLTAT
jgi:hypothetical protein